MFEVNYQLGEGPVINSVYIFQGISQRRAEVARHPHKVEVVGSNPAVAPIVIPSIKKGSLTRILYVSTTTGALRYVA